MKPVIRLMVVVFLAVCGPLTWAAEPVVRVLALFPGKAMLSIDGQRRVLAKGERSPEGIELLDADTERAIVRLAGERLTLTPGGVVNARFAQPSKREVRILRDGNGAYLSSGMINGRAVELLVDTGASSVALNETVARRVGIDYLRDGTPISLQTASGVVEGYVVQLDRVRLGEIELRNVVGNVVMGEGPPRVLLGMSFLNRLQLENRGNILVLRHNM